VYEGAIYYRVRSAPEEAHVILTVFRTSWIRTIQHRGVDAPLSEAVIVEENCPLRELHPDQTVAVVIQASRGIGIEIGHIHIKSESARYRIADHD